MKKKVVLVTGGAGFIGSYVNKRLHRAGYDTIVIDNLSRGSSASVLYGLFIQGDISDRHFLDRLFSNYAVDAVMHFAAHIDVGESVEDPAKYYQNNVCHTSTLLSAMVKHRISPLIFSSSAAIYGQPVAIPMDENHPCLPLNPYGSSKWMVEKILADFDAAYGLKFCALRYFNAAGGDPEGEIKNFQPSSSLLIPKLLLQLKRGRGEARLFGSDYPTRDGSCIRDYVHVDDLAAAHIAAMEKLLAGSSSCSYNLGSGTGYTVLEVIAAIEKVVGRKIEIIRTDRRKGDPSILLADSSKALRELQWTPRRTLPEMIDHAWRSYP